jgi:hypothetical protein
MWRPRARRVAKLTAVAAAIGIAIGVLYQRGAFRPNGPPGSPERALAERCRPKPKDQQQNCYLEGLERLMGEVGVGGAMTTLKALAANDPRVDRAGHVYAHGVGIKAYLRFQDVPATFGQCPTDFSSGCGHGVIQAYLQSQEGLDSAAVNTLCAAYRRPDVSQWQLFQCVHGTGHGLVMMYGGDLPAALVTCDQLRSGWDRDSCYGGAFMENIMEATSPHHPASELAASHGGHHQQTFKAIDSTDLLYPCSVVAERYHRSCYEIQTAAIFKLVKGKIDKASAACDTAPEPMRPTCYASLGRDISARARRDPDRSRKYCHQTGESNRPWCYFGAAKALVDWEAKPTAGLALCERLGWKRGTALCYRAVGEQVATLFPKFPDRESACRAAAEEKAIAACRWGAMIPGSTEVLDPL